MVAGQKWLKILFKKGRASAPVRLLSFHPFTFSLPLVTLLQTPLSLFFLPTRFFSLLVIILSVIGSVIPSSPCSVLVLAELSSPSSLPLLEPSQMTSLSYTVCWRKHWLFPSSPVRGHSGPS